MDNKHLIQFRLLLKSLLASYKSQLLFLLLMDSLEVCLPLVIKVITCGSCQSSLPKVAKVHSEEKKERQEGAKKTVRRNIFITAFCVGLYSHWDS